MPRLRRLAKLVLAALLTFASSASASAHDGPEHEIEELTELLEATPDSPDLLLRRAVEYAVLGRDAEAARDLRHCLRIDPSSLHARRELARIQWRTGQIDDALATLTGALESSSSEPADRAGLLILRAEIFRSRGRLQPALDDCQAALAAHGLNPEWYLLRSDLQKRLGQHARRLEDLEAGIARTGAGLLAVERVEALLDAERFQEALRFIEPELASSRVQCRWLVRRGRARLGLGQHTEGRDDLRRALAEMEPRLARARPDPTLYVDQATAWLHLGDRPAAERVLADARQKSAPTDILERLQALLRAP